ncbi:LacI family DNA-binding transcriptional regulator [Humibacter sp.]|jgi:LacI family transcriptional regulator|uniref:LacI family DNA-binding transcriptional regulator n=1 Tax=Humibacter sp. TaxID=1940291 RepID=UPI002B97E5CA|nr:LacI family DNA-binding transcriptional regulator [Humibacter sp.]HVX06953.1 LacI family DNA-binding transcriptional regulator [Humibacter sp.]
MGLNGAAQAPTLEMVAARAGVSRATVSRVVNGSPKVKPELISAVNAAIAELNYVPNRAARSLASRRTESIALVIPESTSRVFADPFFAMIIQGVAVHLAATDYTLGIVVASEANPDKTRRYLTGGNIDGALVVSHHSGDHSYERLGRTVPVVFGGRPLHADDGESYYVDVDNIAGAVTATRHLIERGRRHIATIAGPADMPAGFDRELGWRRAMTEAGLDTGLIEWGDFSPASGAMAMRRLLARKVPLDAVFAANDQMALGAYAVIAESGLSIPDDIAVVGYDDDALGSAAAPALTTMHQSMTELGAAMAEKLVKLIEGEPAEHATILQTRLIVRGSS